MQKKKIQFRLTHARTLNTRTQMRSRINNQIQLNRPTILFSLFFEIPLGMSIIVDIRRIMNRT